MFKSPILKKYLSPQSLPEISPGVYMKLETDEKKVLNELFRLK